MSRAIELNMNPEPKLLRQFGFVALGGFGVLGGMAYAEWWMFAFGLGSARLPVAAALVGAGLLSAVISLVHPAANRPLFIGLSVLAYPIGLGLSYVLMALLFFGVIGPIALVLRLMRRDPMERGYDREAGSYWRDAHPARDKAYYFKQY